MLDTHGALDFVDVLATGATRAHRRHLLHRWVDVPPLPVAVERAGAIAKALSMIICRVQGGDWAVVVLERLEESLVVLQRRLGWSDAPFLLQEKRKENVAIPTFSFLPLNRGRDHADYQELVLSMAKSTAETSAAKPPTKQDHVEVLSEHPQAKSNIAAAVRSLAWRDMKRRRRL